MAADSSSGRSGVTSEESEAEPATATIEGLFADLLTLREAVDERTLHPEIQDVKHLLVEAHGRGMIDSGMRELDSRDAAEAFVGSVIFATPLLVEDGIFDIAEYLFNFTVYNVPVFLIANTLFVVFMTYALLEWTGRNRAETEMVFGVVPVRLLMTLVISFVVATLLMTVWGRVGGWQSPVEAIARINVLWTVGSLGAALGDIVSKGDPGPDIDTEAIAAAIEHGQGVETVTIREPPASVKRLSDGALVEELNRVFDTLESAVETESHRSEINRLREQTIQAALDDVFGEQIQKYTSRDVAEAFVGSIFFSIPFLVEDGVFDIADFFLSFRIGLFPVSFLANAVFVLVMILALVYWAGPQDVQVNRPILGFIPRRLIGIAVVSFLTAGALMTMWGRVDNWQDPIVALARISVVWTVASFGAALGDILPGESSGDDINDDLADFGRLGESRDGSTDRDR
ncbi:MAG: hypothetical protein V5A52_01690 [Halovenus sp.]|uniref:hypothetical protein n=1 Tax=Halovenus amylolytica TaxID=2500550 RepID=UPI000FE3B5CF